MSTLKKLKTYSKVQKEINYSTLFSDVGKLNDNNNFQFLPSKRKNILNDSESIIETINPSKQSKKSTAPVSTASRGRGRRKQEKTSATDSHNEENNKENKIIDDIKIKKTNSDEEKPVAKQRKTKSDKLIEPEQQKVKQFKLFEDSDSNSIIETPAQKAPVTNEQVYQASLCDDISIVNNNHASRRLKSTKINESSFRTVNDRTASPSATAIVNSAISAIDCFDFQVNNNEKETSTVKSILKQNTKQTVAEKLNTEEQNRPQRPKRIVRILEDINLKNDQLTNIKADNKHKHTAATSTPTGLRRRPLKVPQNVSIISKS